MPFPPTVAGNGRIAAALALLLAMLPALPGNAAPPASATPAITDVSLTTIGGVRYDPAAPLNAVLTPLFDAAHPPTGARTYRVRYRGANGDPVPGFLTLPATEASGRTTPCVLLLHGLGGSKADLLIPAAAFARHGYASLVIDIAGHGERPRIDGKAVDHLSLTEMHTLSAVTAVDLRRAVDFLQSRSDLAPDRIGFLGVSLGGIIGGLFAGYEPRLNAVALWAAGGDWGTLLMTSQHAFAAAFRKVNQLSGPTAATRAEDTLRDVDPLSDISAVSPRPLLFINGTNDTIVPRPCADALYQRAGEPKQRVLLPGGHIPDTSVMILRTLAFFDAALKSRTTAESKAGATLFRSPDH